MSIERAAEVERLGGLGHCCAGGLLAWLWPIGFGGRMPVGGDVTQFSLGLMAVLARALRGGRLPIWNDLWGYGFPGLAESQMGVYYPPHWLLYGLLAARGGLHGEPGAAHALGRPRGLLGRAAVRGLAGAARRSAGFAWATSRLLRDPPAAPVGLHDRVLDALGLGPGLVGR